MHIFLSLLVLYGFQVFAERLPSVTDLTETLTIEEQSALDQQLQTLEQQNHFQAAVLVIPTTGGKNIKFAASQRYGVYHWKPIGKKRYSEGALISVVWSEGLASVKIGHGLEQVLPLEQATQIVRYHMQPEFEENDLFAGLTGGIESIAQFTHIKANLSPLDTLANHLSANPQLSLPCLAWTVLMIVTIIVLWRSTSRPGPGVRMVSMITPTIWFFCLQGDVIIRRVSVVCFGLFFATICWQRLAVIFSMCRVFPMMLAPRNKNAKVKKQKKTLQARESGQNSLFVVMLMIIVE